MSAEEEPFWLEELTKLFEEFCLRGEVIVSMHEAEGEGTNPRGIELIRGMDEGDREIGFRRELAALLNKFSRENGSNTPDFILVDYLVTCLAAFDTASRSREEWYGIYSEAGKGTKNLEGRND